MKEKDILTVVKSLCLNHLHEGKGYSYRIYIIVPEPSVSMKRIFLPYRISLFLNHQYEGEGYSYRSYIIVPEPSVRRRRIAISLAHQGHFLTRVSGNIFGPQGKLWIIWVEERSICIRNLFATYNRYPKH